MSMIIVENPLAMPAPTELQIRKYAADNRILVDFQDYDDVQTLFRRLARSTYGLSEIELYRAIMSIEV